MSQIKSLSAPLELSATETPFGQRDLVERVAEYGGLAHNREAGSHGPRNVGARYAFTDSPMSLASTYGVESRQAMLRNYHSDRLPGLAVTNHIIARPGRVSLENTVAPGVLAAGGEASRLKEGGLYGASDQYDMQGPVSAWHGSRREHGRQPVVWGARS